MAGIIKAGVTDLFRGQSDIVLFDAVDDYKSLTLATLTGGKSLGQIVQNTTEWAGEEPSVSNILDEQGDVITATVTAGTMGFNFQMADTSKETLKEFLKAVDITDGITGLDAWDGEVTAIGFGSALPTITRPIMVINDEQNKSLLLPKAKITSNITISDGLWRISVKVIAENMDTKSMKTGMLIVGKTKYEEEEEEPVEGGGDEDKTPEDGE